MAGAPRAAAVASPTWRGYRRDPAAGGGARPDPPGVVAVERRLDRRSHLRGDVRAARPPAQGRRRDRHARRDRAGKAGGLAELAPLLPADTRARSLSDR